jgi:hypothetical protein
MGAACHAGNLKGFGQIVAKRRALHRILKGVVLTTPSTILGAL